MRNTVRRLVLVVMTMFLYVGLFLSHQQIAVQAEENDNVTFTTPVNNAYVDGLATESLLFTTYHVLPKGSYYLTEDLSINMPLLIEGDFMDPVYLNLNGHSITLSDANTEVIRLKGTPSSGSYRMMQTTLHIYDDKTDTSTTGKITHASGFTGNGINVGRNAHLYMHGGEISGNNGNYGGGVYLFKGANLHMEGGTIKNNTAYEGGGVYPEDATCNVRFRGLFEIANNKKKNNTTLDNLYLPWGGKLDLYHSSNINSSSTVGITTQAKPTSTDATKGVLLWKERNTQIHNNVFVSDDDTYIIHNEGSNGYLTFNQQHSFTVHFETNGGTPLADGNVAATSKVSEPTNVTKTGYTLDGWYTDSGFTKPYNFNNPVLSDLTLYAKWTPNQYTVTFDSNGGTPIPEYGRTREVVYDTTYGELPIPIYPGYKFYGWYTEETSGSEITSTSIVKITSDTTLYARWTNNYYTVTWLNDDGTELKKDENVTHGTTPTYNGEDPTKAADAQYKYTFNGWTPAVSPIYKDTVYIATYTATPKTYTVQWKNGESVLETDENVSYGDIPTYNGATPTKGEDAQYTYTFSGWMPNSTPITGNTVYVAQFDSTLRQYDVIFKNGENNLQSTKEDYGTFPAYNGSTPEAEEGKVFVGWDPALHTVNNENNTYTAVFVDTPKEKYKIKFVRGTDGYSLVDETEYDANTPAESIVRPENPSYGNEQYTYNFTGWTPEVSAVTSDVVYVANYEETAKTFTLEWKDGDGNTIHVDKDVSYGTPLLYDGPIPTKSADDRYTYTFSGYWTAAASQRFDVVRRDETYTACFNRQPKTSFVITWKNYDGTVLETDENVVAGTIPTFNGNIAPTKPSKDGKVYVFDGWDKPVVAANKDEVYTAVFRELSQHTVTLKYPNGLEITSVLATNASIENEPTSLGIERFSGWYDENDTLVSFPLTVTRNLVLTAKQYEYRYIPESNFTWILGTSANQNATVKRFVGETVSDKDGTGAFGTYQSFLDNGSQLYVDDTRLKENEDFIHNKGSLVVTLSADMLNSLSVGTHRLRAVFTDGYADLMFNVINENDPIPAAPEAPHTDNVVTCQMAGFPANYEWNEAAKACQPGYLDESGVFHSTSVRKAAVNTYDKGLEGNKISFVTAMISSFIAAYLLRKFD